MPPRRRTAAGRSVVVTGATGGIGRATALALAGAGFDVIATARSRDKADELSAVAERLGLGLRTVLLDVSEAESCVRAFTEVAALTDGGPWAVVNNAGTAQPGAIEDVDDDAVHQQLEVNLVAPARIARLVLPSMRQRGDGRIINISSVSGRVSSPLIGWYCASKQGLEAVTDALRIEVASFGVKVVLVEPGSFGTGIWATAISSLPDHKRSPYRRSYELADAVMERSAGYPDPAPVARCVVRALTAPRPRARYLVGSDARGGALLDAIAPTPITDYAKEIATGLRTPPDRARGMMAVLSQRVRNADARASGRRVER